MGSRSTRPTRELDDLTARDPGPGEQEGDPQGGLVDEDRVGHLAVLAERLAVVRDHRDHRVLGAAGRAQGREHAAHLGVGERDLAVVGAAAGEPALDTAPADRRARGGRRSAAQAKKGPFSSAPRRRWRRPPPRLPGAARPPPGSGSP